MRVTAEELRFDFKGARFDLSRPGELALLRWIFSQFLYGEVTGIQCGHWLYRAPHLGAATFLARQASEELSHVRKFLRIFSLIGERPERAHPAIRFLSTGMMGKSWGEHVALEMALGEGLVLGAFYALVDTIDDPEIHRILATAAAEEERHVEFGESEAATWLVSHPKDRPVLLAKALLQTWTLSRIRRFISRKFSRGNLAEHPVLRQLDAFFEHSIRCFDLRIDRLGLSWVPVRSMTRLERVWLVGSLPFRGLAARIRRFFRAGAPLLTTTYLSDPALKEEQERFLSSRPASHSD